MISTRRIWLILKQGRKRRYINIYRSRLILARDAVYNSVDLRCKENAFRFPLVSDCAQKTSRLGGGHLGVYLFAVARDATGTQGSASLRSGTTRPQGDAKGKWMLLRRGFLFVWQ